MQDTTALPKAGSQGEDIDNNDTTERSPCVVGYWGRLTAEAKTAELFPIAQDKERLDLVASFCPRNNNNKTILIVTKIVLLGWVISILPMAIRTGVPSFWLAYLTNWTCLLAVLYLILSTLLTVFPNLVANNKNQQQQLTAMVRATWGVFVVAVSNTLAVCPLYWVAATTPPGYPEIMLHGGIFIIVALDGLVINRIPLYVKQVFLLWSFNGLYLLWTVIHWLTGMGNPDLQDEEQDAIYANLDYASHPGFACATLLTFALVVNPVCFLTVRHLSLYDLRCRVHRRYVINKNKTRESTKTMQTQVSVVFGSSSGLDDDGSTQRDDPSEFASSSRDVVEPHTVVRPDDDDILLVGRSGSFVKKV